MTAIHLQPCRDDAGAPRRHDAALDALSEATQWVLGALREWRRRSRDRQQLARVDEHTLADIGLTRGDAEFIANKPFWRE